MTVTEAETTLKSALKVAAPAEFVKFSNQMFYGEWGSGKTTLLGTAADDERLGPVLIIDVEGGLTTIDDKEGIEVVSIRSKAELEQVHEKLYYYAQDHGSLPWQTVGIDSLSELADLDMRVIMKEAYNKNPETVHMDVPSPREWGIVRNHIRLIVRAFRDLPCHCVFTAQLGTRVESEGAPPNYFPGFAGKLAHEVPGFVDVVGFLRVETDVTGGIIRVLQTAKTKRVAAKDRTRTLPARIENPTMTILWDYISNNVKLSDPTQTETETSND